MQAQIRQLTASKQKHLEDMINLQHQVDAKDDVHRAVRPCQVYREAAVV